MATGSKGALDAHISSFHTNINASDWDAAEVDLMEAEATLATLPNTEHAQYRGTLDRLFQMLSDRRKRAQSWKLVHWRRRG